MPCPARPGSLAWCPGTCSTDRPKTAGEPAAWHPAHHATLCDGLYCGFGHAGLRRCPLKLLNHLSELRYGLGWVDDAHWRVVEVHSAQKLSDVVKGTASNDALLRHVGKMLFGLGRDMAFGVKGLQFFELCQPSDRPKIRNRDSAWSGEQRHGRLTASASR